MKKLWYMNADFEMELATAPSNKYFCSPIVAKVNQQLAPHLLWLASKGDSLILEKPWSESTLQFAQKQEVDLIVPNCKIKQQEKLFTPWGWTPSAIEAGLKLGAIVNAPSLNLIKKINSKVFSFSLEQEWGIALKGSGIAKDVNELKAIIRESCPGASDKWVIKSPMGVAARERILGRGSTLNQAATIWVERQFEKGEQLIFQPWLEVIREYGVTIYINVNGEIEFLGVSDLQTNGAGTGIGYLLGRKIELFRLAELKEVAERVGKRLFQEGYSGPAGIDALEHSKGLHPLLEINARYTMGFVAIAVEKALNVKEPTFWQAIN